MLGLQEILKILMQNFQIFSQNTGEFTAH